MHNGLDYCELRLIIVNMERVQTEAILADLNKKMVLIVGPRQAGKTWLAKRVAEHFERPVYLNYDNIMHREQMIEKGWLADTELLILDELHKMPEWKNYLKGLYDTKSAHLKIIVTGSARLDAFKQAGDSLAGRYFVHHLLPFSLSELSQLDQPLDINRLLSRSGFPEPYFSESSVDAKRWRQEYINSLITVDVLDFDNIKNLGAMRTLLTLLQHRVGSPVSYRSLSEDLNIASVTVKKYIDVLESLYIVFRVTPYNKSIARSILKEPKIYFFDTGLVLGDKGAQFENLVAMSLLKSAYARRDYLAEECRVHYLRTKEKKEVDFALVKDGRIERIIEAKYADASLDKNVYYFHQKYSLEATQLVKELTLERMVDDISIVKAINFLKELYL